MKLLLTAILLAAPLLAADIDGKWTGSIDGPGGAIQVVYNLKAEGATLTGNTVGPDGMELKIADGKIDGNNVSFTLNLDFGAGPVAMPIKGVLSGSDLKLTMDFGGMPFEFSLKKS